MRSRAPAKRRRAGRATTRKRAPAKRKTTRRAPAKRKAATRRRRAGRVTTKKRAPAKRKTATRRRRAGRVTTKKRAPAKRRVARGRKPKPPSRLRARRPSAARRPTPLRMIARSKPRASKPAPPPAFPQATGASAKHLLLFRMVKARASVLAAVQGMSAAAAERPLAEGKWNTRETILHLVTRDRARLREMEAALRGTRPSWDGTDLAGQARENEADIAALRHLTWEEAVRLLLTTREQLMEAVESIPEEPADVWDASHPLGWMFQRLPPHDLHHADLIKRRRMEHDD